MYFSNLLPSRAPAAEALFEAAAVALLVPITLFISSCTLKVVAVLDNEGCLLVPIDSYGIEDDLRN